MLSTAGGEVAPLSSDGDDWYLKVLINNSIEFTGVDVWTPPCHVMSTNVGSEFEPGDEST